MKIICLTRSPLDFFGGISIFCLSLYKDFDLEVKCFSYDISNSFKCETRRKISGIEEIVFPSELNYGTISISFGYLKKVISVINEYDVIHTQHPDPFSAIAVIIAKLKKPSIKIITTWHAEVYKSYLLFAPFLLIIDLCLFSLSSKIIYFTPFHIKSSLLAKIPLFRKKIIQIPNTLDTKFIQKYKSRDYKEININQKESINIISVGRLVSYKGYEYAIEALSTLSSRFKYTIVGKGPLLNKLKTLIYKHKLESRVTLLRDISNEAKYKLLDNSDIFLFPSISTSEAYGLVQIEAMCFDLPIINTQLNNGVNFLVPAEDAITCKPKSSIQIKNAILEISTNNKLYNELCNKSKNNLNRFSIDEMINKYKELMLNCDN